MSLSPLPAYLDTRKVFLQQARLSGTMPLERLPRLQALLAGKQADIEAELNCSIDENGLRLIQGELEARLSVVCQRCLEPVEIRLRDQIKLAVLDQEEQARDLDPALDPWICEDYKLDPAELLEEQLILCLPVVNYHQDRDCLGKTRFGEDEAAIGQQPASEDHPFAVLKTLKNKDEQN